MKKKAKNIDGYKTIVFESQMILTICVVLENWFRLYFSLRFFFVHGKVLNFPFGTQFICEPGARWRTWTSMRFKWFCPADFLYDSFVRKYSMQIDVKTEHKRAQLSIHVLIWMKNTWNNHDRLLHLTRSHVHRRHIWLIDLCIMQSFVNKTVFFLN